MYQHEGFNQSRDHTTISHSFSQTSTLLDEEPSLFLFYFLQHFLPHCWHFLWGQKLGFAKRIPPVPTFTLWCLNGPEQPHLDLPPPPPIGRGLPQPHPAALGRNNDHFSSILTPWNCQDTLHGVTDPFIVPFPFCYSCELKEYHCK